MHQTTIHHLSDLHFGPTEEKRGEMDFAQYSDQYLDYLGKIAADDRPDFIVASGDLANRGTKEELEKASDFLEKAAGVADISSKRILVVPGNHDIDWAASGEERQAAFFEATEKFTSVADKFYFDESRGVLFWLLNSAHLSGTYSDSVVRRLEGVSSKNAIDSELLKELREVAKIDPGSVLQEDTKVSFQEYSDARFKIAVLHHPISPTPYEDRKQYPVTMNASGLKLKLQDEGFDLVLHGHVHTRATFYEDVAIDALNKGFYISSAGTLGGESNAENSFNVIRIHESQRSRTHFRIQISSVKSDKSTFSREEKIGDFFRGSETVEHLATPFYTKFAEKKIDLAELDDVLQNLINLEADPGYKDKWLDAFYKHLAGASRAYAIDIQGMSAWSKPSVYRYFLEQVLRRNTALVKSGAQPYAVTTATAEVLERVSEKYRQLGGTDSRSTFRDWNVDDSLEFESVRILLWNDTELSSLGALEVIEMHEAASIPLFFLNAKELDSTEDTEYIFFADDLGVRPEKVTGYYYRPDDPSMPYDDYAAEGRTDNGRILLDEFRELLEHESLLLAKDARQLLTGNSNDNA